MTKLQNRLLRLRGEDQSKYDLRTLERAQASIAKAMAAFKQTVKDATAIIDDDGDDPPEESAEAEALETFNEKVEEAQDLVAEMTVLKQVHIGLGNLRNDVDALQESMDTEPDKNYGTAISDTKAVFTNLRELLDKSTLPTDHHLKQELNRFSILLCKLSPKVDYACEATAPPSDSTTFSTRPKSVTVKLSLPTFDGSLMKWSQFWAQFKIAVDSRKDLSSEHKLAYLRDAIRDPAIQDLLFSGAEREGLYE